MNQIIETTKTDDASAAIRNTMNGQLNFIARNVSFLRLSLTEPNGNVAGQGDEFLSHKSPVGKFTRNGKIADLAFEQDQLMENV